MVDIAKAQTQITGVIALFLMLVSLGCGSGRPAEVDELTTQVRERLKRVEMQTSNSNKEGQEVLSQARERMREVDNLLIEAEYEEALTLLRQVSGDLRTYLAGAGAQTGIRLEPVKAHGLAEYQVVGSQDWVRMTGDERPRILGALRTSFRAGIHLEMEEGLNLDIASESEVVLREQAGGTGDNMRIKLVKGSMTVEVKGSNTFTAILGDVPFDVQGPAIVEVSNQTITKTRYICVFSGRAVYDDGETTVAINSLEGMRWRDGSRNKFGIPGMPRGLSPEDNITIYTSGREQSQVTLEWFDAGASQLQISRDPYFFSRVFDNPNLAENAHTLTLDVGEYYWRVRAFEDNRLPGPFCETRRLVISRDAGTNALEKTITNDLSAEGPPINNVRVEIFKPNVMVSGTTDRDAKIRVNGELAVVTNGKFQIIIEIPSGRQTITIESLDPVTGGRSQIQKPVNMP